MLLLCQVPCLLRHTFDTHSASPDCLPRGLRPQCLIMVKQNQASFTNVATRVYTDTHFYHFLSLTPPSAAQACTIARFHLPVISIFLASRIRNQVGRTHRIIAARWVFSCCTYRYIAYIQQHTTPVAASLSVLLVRSLQIIFD